MSALDTLSQFDKLSLHDKTGSGKRNDWSDVSNNSSTSSPTPRHQSTSQRSSSNDSSPFTSRDSGVTGHNHNVMHSGQTGGTQAQLMNDVQHDKMRRQSKYSFNGTADSTPHMYTLQSIAAACQLTTHQFDMNLMSFAEVQSNAVLVDVLANEACALCLQQYASANVQTEQYVTLTCKLLQCTHLVHADCLMQSVNNSAMPVLDSMHATSFFRVVPCTAANFQPVINSTGQHNKSHYEYAIGVTHYTSNAQLLHAVWPSVPAVTTESSQVCLMEPSQATIQSLIADKTSQSDLCINILRGRIIFKCIDDTTQSHIYHMCNYDISSAKHIEYLHLVLVDTRSRNVLTVGLKQRIVGHAVWYNIAFIKYELSATQQYQPVLVQPTQFIPQRAPAAASNTGSTASHSPPFQPLLPSDLIDPVKLPSASELAYSRNLADAAMVNNNGGAYGGADQLRSYAPVPTSQFIQQQRNRNMPHQQRSYADPYNSGEYNQYDDQDQRRGGNNRQRVDHDDNPLYLPALPTAASVLGNMSTVPVLELTIDQCVGNVVRLAKSHSGSRFVQQRLEQHDPEYFDLFFSEMQQNIAELMVDNFAHFAIEKLFQQCNEQQLLYLLQQVSPQLSYIACQKHGSFSVQALVDTVHTPDQIQTVCAALQQDATRLITHASGHFVLLRILQKFDVQYTRFIDDAVTAGCGSIGTDHHGLRVIKAVLAVRRPNELSKLFKQASRLTMKLVENQYGNYLIQSILDCAPPAVRTNIKVKMEGKFMRLSKQKFSSNVVEKCLKQSSAHWRNIIIRELIAQPAVGELLRDRYGNFVIQCSLTVANAQQIQEISAAITPYLHTLRDNVKSKWHRLLHKAETNGFMRHQTDERITGRDSANESPTLSLADSEPSSPIQSYNPQRQSFQQHHAGGGGQGGGYTLNERIDLNQSHMIYQNLPYY